MTRAKGSPAESLVESFSPQIPRGLISHLQDPELYTLMSKKTSSIFQLWNCLRSNRGSVCSSSKSDDHLSKWENAFLYNLILTCFLSLTLFANWCPWTVSETTQFTISAFFLWIIILASYHEPKYVTRF